METNNSRYPQARRAQEIAIRARAEEQRQRLMVAEMRADREANRQTRGFLSALLTSLRIF